MVTAALVAECEPRRAAPILKRGGKGRVTGRDFIRCIPFVMPEEREFLSLFSFLSPLALYSLFLSLAGPGKL